MFRCPATSVLNALAGALAYVFVLLYWSSVSVSICTFVVISLFRCHVSISGLKLLEYADLSY
jgi:hypothetical protein